MKRAICNFRSQTRLGVLLWIACVAGLCGAGQSAPAVDLVGTTPPDWDSIAWLHSPPFSLKELRGKVVLVRWWTAPGCQHCEASAPALNKFHQEYAARGLEVIGLYHHKSEAPLKEAEVEAQARRLGFKFRIGIDHEWKTLDRWWLGTGDRSWTSASFLLDRSGVIRLVHPGGQCVKGDPDHTRLREKIEELLSQE